MDAADEAEFMRRFKNLFNRRPEDNGKRRLGLPKREVTCKYCDHPHCACDECEFYHMVLCGLIDCGVDCMVDVVNFNMDSDAEELHNVITLDADEEQLLCSDGPLAPDENESLLAESKYRSNIMKKKLSKEGVRDVPDATNSFMAEETKKLANFTAFKEVKKAVRESADDEKVNTEMIFGVPAGVLESSSLFTLHETTEMCKQLSDAQSNWDTGLNCPFTCKCEQEDSEDEENYYDASHLPSCKSSQSKQRLNRTIPRKSVLMKRAKSSTAVATTKLTSTMDGQCYISEDKKSVVHVDKKGICVTQITKAKATPRKSAIMYGNYKAIIEECVTLRKSSKIMRKSTFTIRGRFMPKRQKASSNGAAGLVDNHVSNEDSDEVSADESSEVKAADIQRISEKIVQEIERSFAAEGGVLNRNINNGSDRCADGRNKGCFSNFFNPGCRKLIESLMRRHNSDVDTNSNQSMARDEEEDTSDSRSVDLSEEDECQHYHDSCSTQSGEEENRDRDPEVCSCYCTYLSGDMPSRHDGRRNEEIRERLRKVLKKREKQWDAERGHSLSSEVRDRVSEAETKMEVKNELVEERSLEELLQFINEKTPTDTRLTSTKAAKKARQKQRKLEEKKKAEEEERARQAALEKEKAEKEAKLAAENARKIQEEKSKSRNKHKQKQQAELETKEIADRKSVESAAIDEVSNDKDQITSAKAANKARQRQKKLDDKRKQDDERQRKVIEERQRQEVIKKEKVEKEARLQEEKRKRTEEQKQAKLEKTEKKKVAREESKRAGGTKILQSKGLKLEYGDGSTKKTGVQQEVTDVLLVSNLPIEVQTPAVDTDVPIEVPSQLITEQSAPLLLHSGVDVSAVPPSYVDASSSYFLSNGAKSFGQHLFNQFAVTQKEQNEEIQHLRQHASLIAVAAAANGTPLPPLSSLSLDQQQQYFAWIKQLQMAQFYSVPLSSAPSTTVVPNNLMNCSSPLLNPGFVAPVHSTSLPSSRYGAIGEKLPQRKTFNQYAAYDRETNHILGISQPSLVQFGGLSSTSTVSSPTPSHVQRPSSVTSNMATTNAALMNPILKEEAARFCAIENTLSTTAISNNQPFQDLDRVNLEVLDRSGLAGPQQQNAGHFSSASSLFAEKIGCAAAGSSSIWSHDDDAKRFVEQEECAIFKFSEC